MGEAPGPGARGKGIDAPGAARDAPGAALVDARPTASVGGAATAFDDDVGLLVEHGRSEGESGSGATGSGGRSRRKAGQASAQGLIEEIGVWTRQRRCSTSCASCRPPPNSEAGLESHKGVAQPLALLAVRRQTLKPVWKVLNGGKRRRFLACRTSCAAKSCFLGFRMRPVTRMVKRRSFLARRSLACRSLRITCRLPL